MLIRAWIIASLLATSLCFAQTQETAPILEYNRVSANPVEACEKIYAGYIQVESRPEGPRLYIKPTQANLQDIKSIQELVVGQYNVENLYNYRGRWVMNEQTGQREQVLPPEPKPQSRWEKLKEVLLRSNDDIMVWEEVEDLQAAKDFIDQELGGKYNVVLIEGNDERGIDIAFVYRKDLPFEFVVQSHRNEMTEYMGRPKKLYSRDAVVVHVQDTHSKKLLMKYVLVHNKSQRDSPGDPLSEQYATMQFAGLKSIAETEKNLDPKVPVFLLGDGNREYRKSPAVKPLKDIGFVDVLGLGSKPIPVEDRDTHSYFDKEGHANYSELDLFLMLWNHQEAASIVKLAEIMPYLQPDGVTPYPKPSNFEERSAWQASDHFKLRVVLLFQKLLSLTN